MNRPLVTGRFQSRDELIHGPHTEHLVTQGMSRFKSVPANGNPDLHFLVFPQPLQANANGSPASRQATTTSLHIHSVHYWLIILSFDGAKYDVWKSVVERVTSRSFLRFLSTLPGLDEFRTFILWNCECSLALMPVYSLGLGYQGWLD